MLRQELIDYSNQVISGEIVACKKHKWACMRFLRDLENEGTEKFPFVFDEDSAERFLDWMRLFKHRKGVLKGQHIEPHIIQKFIFGNIYGWIHMETGYRRFTKAYWQVGRKNAKSQTLAIVASYELIAMHEPASEVYCAATKTEQAKIVWKETEAMLDECPELKNKINVAYGEIQHPLSRSFMKALSKDDKKSGDGYNPQCGIIDEYHAHETSEMYDVIDSGMGARTQPLIMIITTAGLNLNNPCYRVEYHLVSKILNPALDYSAEFYFVMINELEKDDDGNLIDDINDESCWIKANPITCSYPEGVKYIRERLQLAREAPEKMRELLTKNFNIWVAFSEHGYMNLDKWGACKVDKLPDLTGLECYLGIDLSSKIDLTSATFEFPIDDKYVIKSHSFMPEETLIAKRNTDKGAYYDLWIKQGYITMTPGAVVDYRFVKKWVCEQIEANGWKVKEICFDPYSAQQISKDFEDDGFATVEIIQGKKTLSEPTKSFRELAYEKRIIHDGDPVFSWAVSNAVTNTDDKENIQLDKAKSTNRIDPLASAINAHVRAIANEDTSSPYEERGILFF